MGHDGGAGVSEALSLSTEFRRDGMGIAIRTTVVL